MKNKTTSYCEKKTKSPVPAFVWAFLPMKPPIEGITIVIVVIVCKGGVAVTITRCIYIVLFRFYRIGTSLTRWTGTCRCCCCGCGSGHRCLPTVWQVRWLASQNRMSIFIGRWTRTFGYTVFCCIFLIYFLLSNFHFFFFSNLGKYK